MGKQKQVPIDPKHFYTLSEIVRLGLIPGVDNVVKMSRIAHTDKMRGGPLQATQVARGVNGVQYKVKGANIINYLANLDG